MSRVGPYQVAAAHRGTVIERATKGVPPRIDGGITKHPVVRTIAETLISDPRQLGSKARICRNPSHPADSRVFIHLSGGSSQKGGLA